MSRQLLPIWVCVYVALVLLVDTLTSQDVLWIIDWEQLDWKPTHVYGWLMETLPGIPREYIAWMRHGDLHRFEVFKFIFWFFIPFIFCLPRMDWRWIGWRHWYGSDVAVLLALALCGMVAMLIIPEFQSLREQYPSMSILPLDMKLSYLGSKLFWILSWLVGWEFLHRYVLLRASLQISPRWGWWLVPLSEGLYHLQKPLLEAGGMVVLSIILTQWAMRRQNLLLPLLVHFIIELELLLFVLFA